MATRDILDYLAPEYDRFNNQPDRDYLLKATRKIVIAPKWWKKYGKKLRKINFNWKEIRYTNLDKYLSSSPSAASKTGIYLFTIKPDIDINGLPGYVFYVGIAGERGSGRFLRQRLREYIQISSVKKRDKVKPMLAYYYRHVYIYYSELDDNGQLEELEKYLHGFYMPWANDRDFPTHIKRALNAWN